MNQWLNDLNPIANGHATHGHTPDLPMSFPQQPQTINPAQFQNQAFLNGGGRTASPAFHQPMYQTNQVIPSKRSREDSLGTSPRPSHNAPPGSRSQTPSQGPFPGYNPQANGAPAFTSAPAPFSHLQTSNNATPSPTMQQMGFAPGNPGQRVSTASPSPFSPQHSMPSASPGGPVSDRGRMGTPHDASQPGMQYPGMTPQQFSQGTMPPMGMGQMGMGQRQMPPGPMNPAQQIYQNQLKQMQLQAQNGIPSAPQGQMNGMMPGPQDSTQQLKNTPQDFFRNLQQFANAKGRPIDMRPHVCGRQVDALRLYQAIMRLGGSNRVAKMGQWPVVAQAMQLFPPQQIQQAAMEIQQYWMTNVTAFEQMWIQKQRQAQMGSPTREAQTPSNHQRAPSDMMQRQVNGQAQHTVQHANGISPTKEQNDPTPTHQRQSLSRQLDPSQLNGMLPEAQTETPQKRPLSAVKAEPEPQPESTMPVQKPIEDPFVPEVMSPSRHHGPINVEEMFALGQQLIEIQPTVPSLRELGVIDIHALTMAVKSGMHAETRNALDTLITLSSEPSLQIQLDLCDDLMETLVDCAQVEVDFLADHASEVSDEISLPSYEELVRSSHVEAKTVQTIPTFGSLDYDLDRSADRLICITTLIRNFSFYEPNFATLGQVEVVQLLTRVVQHIGTKDMPLRNSRNTLDFMKDIIIYLSNLSSSLHLPSKQDALCLLHFLLSFAPTPPPISSVSEKIAFSLYSPSIHKYLPPAVDSLAKLLARDEPNRMYFKAIFHADGRAAIPYELLTRTFGLVIAPIPHSGTGLRAQIEARKPFLLQGMLAAEILASLAPGSENPLARSWLQSEDCFAGNMLKMASALSVQPQSASSSRQPPNSRNPPHRGHDDDPTAHGSIVSRAMAILRILVNKSRITDAEGDTSISAVPVTAVIKKENLLGAMIQKDIDANMLRLVCQYAGVED